MTTPCHVDISSAPQSPPGTELFSVLERLLPVRFAPEGRGGGVRAAGKIGVHGMADPAASPVPSLAVAPALGPARVVEAEVEFADDPDVPFPFRGRTVRAGLDAACPALAPEPGEKALATSELGPIWTLAESGSAKRFRSALPLPELAADQGFADAFNGGRFLEALPLLHFIRAIGADAGHRPPPLRAGFIIDDPNLHWPSYGFVDYRETAARARRENYHVAFATIPLDAWFTHAGTAGLFRENARWLSLLIHGNNHAKRELALDYPQETRRALLSQAIRRTERLEREAGFRVCRVMVPPHGACSGAMLAELPQCGFEAACISAGSLKAHNPGLPWTRILGFLPAELVEGCPVLPRWGLDGNAENALLVAAYLGQPMILRGHHQDLRQGLEVLDERARFINGLGEVSWPNLTGLSRLSYLWRMEGTVCRLKPLGVSIAFAPPGGATHIAVEGWGSPDREAWRITAADGSAGTLAPGEPFPLPEARSRPLLIGRAPPLRAATASHEPPPSAGLVLRRLLTEARDRFWVFQGAAG